MPMDHLSCCELAVLLDTQQEQVVRKHGVHMDYVSKPSVVSTVVDVVVSGFHSEELSMITDKKQQKVKDSGIQMMIKSDDV